jgi:thymidylate synthase (FAD)
MNDLIGEKNKVLDNGFVRLIDCMGTDESIAQAARVSYAKGTKTAQDDESLVRFLMRHKHYSPFGQCQVKFHVRLPIFIHNQWVR